MDTSEDGDTYAKIDDVLNESTVIATESLDLAPPLPKLPYSLSISSSHSSSLSGSPGRARSESMFTRSSQCHRPISILDDDVGMQKLRDLPHRVENSRGHASLAIKFAESGK